MKPIFEFIIRLLKFHKLKMLLVIVSSVFFVLLLFPFSDITDLVTGKILEGTNNQVFLQADKLDLGLFPGLSVVGTNVSVDVARIPETLQAKKLEISPSVFSLLALAFGANPNSIRVDVDANGLMGGDVSISHKPNGSNDEGAKKNHLSVRANNVQLNDVVKLADSPLSFEGKANFATDFDFYPGFDGQPEGEVTLSSKGVKIPPGTVPTQLGPLALPGFNWSALNIKAHMAANNFVVDEVAFGTSKDPLSGRVKGNMNMKVDANGPILGAYDFKIELSLTSTAEKELDSFLILVKDFRQQTSTGGKYIFHASANSIAAQPNFGRLQSF
jgi:type II secretion system protein N